MTFEPERLVALSLQRVEDVILIDGAFYDTHRLAAIHPGGPLMVCLNNRRDGTALFRSCHRRPFPHHRYASMRVPTERVAPAVRAAVHPNHQTFSLYEDLCARVSPLLRASRGYAPPSYAAKVVLWLGLCVALDVAGAARALPLAVTALRSLLLAFIGLNIQHDANHGAISARPSINRFLGLTQDYIGGSSLSWLYYHDVIHHVHCNDEGLDADLQVPLLRLTRETPRRPLHRLQHVYVVLLQLSFGLVHLISSIWLSYVPPTAVPFSTLHRSYWRAGRVATVFAVARVAALWWHHSPAEAALHTIVLYAIGGLYLSIFFLMSHNYSGVVKAAGGSTTGCFVAHQVETSSNVGGAWLGWLNGGLNYQIEHHLFPRVHHSHYPTLAPVVKACCEGAGVKYHHFPHVGSNVWSTLQHLWKMGRTD